jgi:hypothetical protein
MPINRMCNVCLPEIDPETSYVKHLDTSVNAGQAFNYASL